MIKNILVADDDLANAYLVARRLKQEGFHVLTAANGLKALEKIKSNPVDLLITDVVMPEMDGVDLYLSLKQDTATATLPIIIVTDKEMFQESFSQLGVEFYCPKPYNFEELLGKIHKVASQISDARLFHKVVIFGPDLDALNKMAALLKERSCIVSTVENVIEIGLRCFLNNPHLILLDLHSKEYATTREIIRSLRSYEFFKKSDIIVYSNFVSGDMAVIAGMDSLDDEIHSCLKEGANKYIGRFNQVNFLDQLKEFGI